MERVHTHTHTHLPQQVWAWCEELPFAAAACVWSLWPWIVHWLCLQHSNSFQFVVFSYSAEMAIFVLYHLISSLALMNMIPKKRGGLVIIRKPWESVLLIIRGGYRALFTKSVSIFSYNYLPSKVTLSFSKSIWTSPCILWSTTKVVWEPLATRYINDLNDL